MIAIFTDFASSTNTYSYSVTSYVGFSFYSNRELEFCNRFVIAYSAAPFLQTCYSIKKHAINSTFSPSFLSFRLCENIYSTLSILCVNDPVLCLFDVTPIRSNSFVDHYFALIPWRKKLNEKNRIMLVYVGPLFSNL